MKEKSKIKINLKKTQETLCLCLWARATESKRPNTIFKDVNAEKFIDKIDYDWDKIEKNYKDECNRIALVSRAKTFDFIIKEFISSHPKATIVNIGAGLDSTFSRVDNGFITWYDLDLPDVIKLRKKLIKESNRVKFIAKSVFDFSWFDEIEFNHEEGILFVAGGLYYYFKKEDVKKLFLALASNFPGGEHIFDALSKSTTKLSGRLVRKTINEKSKMYFSLNSPKVLEKWDSRINIVKDIPYYKYIPRDHSLKKRTLLKMYLCDRLGFAKYIHLQFKPTYNEDKSKPDMP